MQSFDVDSLSRSQSIAFDATDRGGLVVTVGVEANRTQEATLLNELYEVLSDDGYEPFRTKSRDLSLDPRAVSDVVSNFRGRIGVCLHEDDVKLPYAEAVHSAILLEELRPNPTDTVCLVDGDTDRGEKLRQASAAIGLSNPPIVPCVQSELYYPHSLLADLVAGIVADETLDDERRVPSGESSSSFIFVETTGQSRTGRWGKAYSAVARSEGNWDSPEVRQRYADSVPERVSCWFRGTMARKHAPPPSSDGLRPVVRRLDAMGCETVATWLAEE